MTDHLVLIFAYHYPPEDVIGAARPFRFAKYLFRLGYKCRVFTAAEQLARSDPDTEYVPDPFITYSRRSPSWQMERAVRKLLLPGERGMHWSDHACRAARAYIKAHPAARVTLFSTFPPLGPPLAAWQLARSENLHWIADFRDPIPDAWNDESAHWLQNRVYRRLERGIAQTASAVIFNTDTAMAKWEESFPTLAGKAQVIWNGFDPEDRVASRPLASGTSQILSHTGELYGGRDVTPILESIRRLMTTDRLPARGVRVRLIGAAEPEALPNQEFLDRIRSAGWLELVSHRVSKHEASRIVQSSDGLLLVQPQSATQVPGKLFEYLQIGRPILAFVQPDSPSERLLAQSGVPYRCVYPGSAPDEVDDIVAGFFSLSSEPVALSPLFEEQFNAEFQTTQLDAIIRQLHNQPVRDAHPLPRGSVAEYGTVPARTSRGVSGQLNSQLSDTADTSVAKWENARVGKNPLVSVIIPAYNTAPYIVEALDSAFAQTFDNFEVIVINDGSPDTEVLESLLAPYQNRIVYIKHENRGLPGARNTGIRQARGEFLAFLDSDDCWSPNYLESQMNIFGKTPSLDVLYSDALLFGDSLHSGKTFMQAYTSNGPVTLDSLIQEECQVITSCTVARRQVVVDAGLFDENFSRCEDFDLWLRILHNGGQMAYQREVLGRYRTRPGSLSRDTVKVLQALLQVYKKIEKWPGLSHRTRILVQMRAKQIQANLDLESGRVFLATGEFERARDSLKKANDFFHRRKLRMTILGLQVAPDWTRYAVLTWQKLITTDKWEHR